MRKIYLLPVLLVPFAAMSQFGPPAFLDVTGSTNSNNQFIKTADIDGNGTKDIIVSNDVTSEIRIFSNNGNLSFSAAANVASAWNRIASMDVADMNNDGKPDIVVVENISQTLSWHPNTNGSFPQKTLIKSGINFVMGKVLCHDFNSDGNVDILLVNHSNVLLFLNSGGGNFNTGQNVVLPNDETEFYDIVLGDFNNDSFKDFALASGGFEVYLNNGQAQFTRNNGVSDNVTMLIGAGDFNNDGLDDVTFKTNIMKGGKNSTSGSFTLASVSPSGMGIKSVYCSDLDNDGFDDILTQDNQTGKVFWYKSIGNGTFAAKEDIFTLAGSFLNTVYADDLDGDGDQEVIWTNGGGIVAVHSNQAALSVNKNIFEGHINIYPNPAYDVLYLSANDQALKSVTIYNSLGQKVMSAPESEIAAMTIKIDRLQAGAYFVQINNGTASTNLKFIKL